MKKTLILITLMITVVLFSSTAFAYDESAIDGPDVIFKQDDRVLVMSDILELFSYQESTFNIENDAYTGHGDIPGIYSVTISSSLRDINDQVITKTFDISVRNYIGDVTAVTLKGEQYTIYVSKDNILSQEDIIDIMVNINVITITSQTQVNYLTDNYTENSNAPGLYTFEFRIATTSGIEQTLLINILVSNSDTLSPDLELAPEPSWISKNITTLIFTVIGGLGIYLFLKKKKVI